MDPPNGFTVARGCVYFYISNLRLNKHAKENNPIQEQLIQSAKTTLSYFSIKSDARFLLCIHPQFIGGAMQIVRAFVNQGRLDILAPEKILDIDHTQYDLVSMVPYSSISFISI